MSLKAAESEVQRGFESLRPSKLNDHTMGNLLAVLIETMSSGINYYNNKINLSQQLPSEEKTRFIESLDINTSQLCIVDKQLLQLLTDEKAEIFKSADAAMQQSVLLPTTLYNQATLKSIVEKNLNQQLSVLPNSEEALNLWEYKLQLLETIECRILKSKKSNTQNTPNYEYIENYLIRYYAYRRRDYLQSLQSKWLATGHSLNARALFDLLQDESDLRLLDHHELITPTLRSDPEHTVNEIKLALFDLTAERKKLEDELDNTIKLRDPDYDLKEKIKQIREKENTHTQLLEKNRSLKSLSQEAFKDYASDKLNKDLPKEGKKLLSKVAEPIFKAVVQSIKGEEIDKKALTIALGKEIGSTAIRLASNFVLGPFGNFAADGLIDLAFPNPQSGPTKIEKSLISIQNELKDGFKEINDKVDDLKININDSFKDLNQKIIHLDESIEKRNTLQTKITKFETLLSELNSDFNKVTEAYKQTFENGVFIDNPWKLEYNLSVSLKNLIEQFYRPGFEIKGSMPSNSDWLPPSKESLAYSLIEFNNTINVHPKSFDQTIEIIITYAYKFHELINEYFNARNKIYSILGATALYSKFSTKDRFKALSEHIDLHLLDTNDRVQSFLRIGNLGPLVIGKSAYTLWKLANATRRDYSIFSMLNGFALVPPTHNKPHSCNEEYQLLPDETALISKPIKDCPARYYLAPQRKGNDLISEIYTFQNGELPQCIRCRIVLEQNHTLRLYYTNNTTNNLRTTKENEENYTYIDFDILTLDHEYFNSSIERFILNQAPIDLDNTTTPLKVHLPRRGWSLKIGIQQSIGYTNLISVWEDNNFRQYWLPIYSSDDDPVFLRFEHKNTAIELIVEQKRNLEIRRECLSNPTRSHSGEVLRFGVWSPFMAYKPMGYNEDTMLSNYRKINQRPFDHVLYPGETLINLVSLNNKHSLSTIKHARQDPMSFIGNLSVFSKYTFKNGIQFETNERLIYDQIHYKLLKDSRFALYYNIAPTDPIAITDFHQPEPMGCVLCLDDDGVLALREPTGDGRIVHKLGTENPKIEYANRALDSNLTQESSSWNRKGKIYRLFHKEILTDEISFISKNGLHEMSFQITKFQRRPNFYSAYEEFWKLKITHIFEGKQKYCYEKEKKFDKRMGDFCVSSGSEGNESVQVGCFFTYHQFMDGGMSLSPSFISSGTEYLPLLILLEDSSLLAKDHYLELDDNGDLRLRALSYSTDKVIPLPNRHR